MRVIALTPETFGHEPRAIELLRNSGLIVELFAGVAENPTTQHVDAGLAVANDFRPDLIVGVGGGSSMDCAKGSNFVYSCGGRMQLHRRDSIFRRRRVYLNGSPLPRVAVERVCHVP